MTKRNTARDNLWKYKHSFAFHGLPIAFDKSDTGALGQSRSA